MTSLLVCYKPLRVHASVKRVYGVYHLEDILVLCHYHHNMEMISKLLALFEGNHWSLVDSPHRLPITQSNGVYLQPWRTGGCCLHLSVCLLCLSVTVCGGGGEVRPVGVHPSCFQSTLHIKTWYLIFLWVYQGLTSSFVWPSGTGEKWKKNWSSTGHTSIWIVRRDRYTFHIHMHYLLARTFVALWGTGELA